MSKMSLPAAFRSAVSAALALLSVSMPASVSAGVCPRPPHPLVPQYHPAPQSPSIALMGIVYSDWEGPSVTAAKLREWFDGASVDFIKRVSGGCTVIEFTTFVVTVPQTERKDGGDCRTQPEDMAALTLPSIPGYSPLDYFGTVVTPVGENCPTSASVGGLSLNIGGNVVELGNTMFIGRVWSSPWNDSVRDVGPVGDETFVHELLHMFGAGYHSNAKACNNPGIDQTDLFACPTLQYGDLFDLLGTSGGVAPNVNAYLRYHFGWLGGDDLVVLNTRGSGALSPLETRNGDGTAATGHPVAAVLPLVGLWLEWRSAMDSDASAAPLLENPGFFVRRYADLLDLDLHTCKDGAFGYDNYDFENYPERLRVTLLPGNTAAFRSYGALIQADPAGVDKKDGTMSLHVHFTGAPPPCTRMAPDIAVGIIGEWKFCDQPWRERCEFGSDRGLAPLDGFARRTLHVLNWLSDGDSIGCGDGSQSAVFDIRAASPLPEGWAFATQKVTDPDTFQGCEDASLCSAPAWSPIGGGFAFGVPDSAADGDYDFCITGTKRDSGLVAAKILRVSLPEEDNEWYSNNRPAAYTNVDKELAAACAALNGSCATDRDDCELPRTNNCKVNQKCPYNKKDPSISGWGRCWAGADGVGRRYRGRNIDTVTQSVCAGGPALLESEACAPALLPPCADQRGCTVPSDVWERLYTEDGDGTGPCARCGPGGCASTWEGLCDRNGPGFGAPVCDLTSEGGGGSLETWDHPCHISTADGSRMEKFNATCVRELCDSYDLCGGYMANVDRTLAYLYPTDISRPTSANPWNPHQCWKKPSKGDTTCTCIGGPLVPSEGCTENGFSDLKQWVGPTCNSTSLSQLPSLLPSNSPSNTCLDESDFRFNKDPKKQFGCAKYTKSKTNKKCKKWDKHGRLVRNHCPKSCGYCTEERCTDDPKFKIKIEVGNKLKRFRCNRIPNKHVGCDATHKKGTVGEFCRGSCGLCDQ